MGGFFSSLFSSSSSSSSSSSGPTLSRTDPEFVGSVKEWKDWVDGTTPLNKQWISNPAAWAKSLSAMAPYQRQLMIDMIDLFSEPKYSPKGEKLVVSDEYLRILANWVGPECFTLQTFESDKPPTHCPIRARFLKNTWKQKWMQPFETAERAVLMNSQDAARMGWIMATLPGPSKFKAFDSSLPVESKNPVVNKHNHMIQLYYLTNRTGQSVNIVLVPINRNGRMVITVDIVSDMSELSLDTLRPFYELESNTGFRGGSWQSLLQDIFRRTAGSNLYSQVYKAFALFMHPDQCEKRNSTTPVDIDHAVFKSLGVENSVNQYMRAYLKLGQESSDFNATCNETFKFLQDLYENPFA